MKKALALVLALVLALSMAVSAFAADLVVLNKEVAAEDELPVLDIVEFDDYVIYVETAGVYYIALENKAYTDITVTANGCVDAELVKYDPEKMVVEGNLVPTYSITEKGKVIDTDVIYDLDLAGVLVEGDMLIGKSANGATSQMILTESAVEAIAKGADLEELVEEKWFPVNGAYPELVGVKFANGKALSYEQALAVADSLNDAERVTYYGIKLNENVNIIKVTVADNFSAHYEEGTIKIEAKLAGKPYSAVLTVINDVVIFEYEEVKWAARNGESLQLGANGYSDFFTAEYGYDFGDWEYDEDELRLMPYALVVSTTAFRAIEGEDLTLDIIPEHDFNGDKDVDMELSVTLKEIVKGQKGVNFFTTFDVEWDDEDEDEYWDAGREDLESITLTFEGNQVIKGEYEIVVELPYDYYELREAFGLKVEEDDIITYYIVDEDGKVVGEMPIDYMTLDLSKNVKFAIKGENDTLGAYTLCLEVPAVETETEENPNTGAESVVGVVAALAVVSVATAAAVSLKK